jgi:3-phenylpropionate/trans-cinnamate dioxygenase ferredoxin subunit
VSVGKRACAVDDLPEVGAIQVVIDGDAYAIVRDEEVGIHALEDRCTHAEVALSEGEVDDDCSIECWLHGSRFDLRTGAPLELPAVTPVRVYSVTLEGDDVYVDVTRDVGEQRAAAAAAAKEG